MLQRFNMPTQTIPMLSKKPKAATADLHKDLLGTRNPGLGYIAKRAQPVLYDADTLLHPAHHPVRIWDSEDKELSQEQAYWLSANEIASNASNPATVTPFVHNRATSSQSKGRTVADSIAERLTRPTAYKFKTDCSIIPVWMICFNGFDDDEVILPPVVPIPLVNVHAAPAPENANGSPSTTVISEGAPAVTESLLPHQIPLPDNIDI
ncbi:hypothetical protein Tco_1200742 [Tanacetum coccineum]